jgi:hypothetical protein
MIGNTVHRFSNVVVLMNLPVALRSRLTHYALINIISKSMKPSNKIAISLLREAIAFFDAIEPFAADMLVF